MIKNLRDMINLQKEGKNVAQEIIKTIEALNKDTTNDFNIDIEWDTRENDGIVYGVAIQEFSLYYLKNISITDEYIDEDYIILSDGKIRVSVPYKDMSDDDYEEKILLFNQLQEMEKFDIGDVVEIQNDGQEYIGYKDMYNYMKRRKNNIKQFLALEGANTGSIGKVVSVQKHLKDDDIEISNDILALIEINNQSHLLSINGLKKVV